MEKTWGDVTRHRASLPPLVRNSDGSGRSPRPTAERAGRLVDEKEERVPDASALRDRKGGPNKSDNMMISRKSRVKQKNRVRRRPDGLLFSCRMRLGPTLPAGAGRTGPAPGRGSRVLPVA